MESFETIPIERLGKGILVECQCETDFIGKEILHSNQTMFLNHFFHMMIESLACKVLFMNNA